MYWTSGVLADGPISFRGCDDIVQVEPKEFHGLLSSLWQSDAEALAAGGNREALPAFTVTNLGIWIPLPRRPYYGCPSVFQVALACRRRNRLMPLTIDLAAFLGPIYYRYSGLLVGPQLPVQPFPENQRLHLAYRNEIPHGITIKLIGTSALYKFHRRLVFPESTQSKENSLELSRTDPLAIVVYANASNAFFAVACGYCFGQGWVHIICDEGPNTPLLYAKKIYKQMWNRGAEQACLMAKECSGKVTQPFYVKHGHLLGTTWAVRVACGGWGQSNNRIVTVDVVEFPGGRCKLLIWEEMYGTKSYANADIPCLMREILWFRGRPDGHQIEGCPEVFSVAPTQRQIKVGDYGVISGNNVGYFECRGNIFNETEASKMKVGQYTNTSPLKSEVTSRFIPYGTLTSSSQDAGLVLHDPKLLSLLNTQRVLDLLKQLSPRMRDYALVTSVVECSACSLTGDFKAQIEKQMRRYPKMWQGYARDAATNLQPVTPLYTIATPWVWHQGEPNGQVTSDYQKIWKYFNVIKGYPPAHHKRLREKAVEFFEDKFGVKHLDGLVGSVTFFERLPSYSSKHQGPNAMLSNGTVLGSPSDPLKSLEESRSRKLVMEFVEAMRGVTHHRDNKWLSSVKRNVFMVQKVTNTLSLGFLVDVCDAFPAKTDALNSFTEGKKTNYSTLEYLQPLVKEVEDLQVKYYTTKDAFEKLALEEDVVGKILEVCRYGISLDIQYTLGKVVHETLHYGTTDKSTDLPEKQVRFECLKVAGEFFQDVCSEVPHDNTAHLRRPMANARDGVSMHELYCKAREERRDGGFGGILD